MPPSLANEFYQKKWRTAQQETKESSETGEQQKTKEEQQKTQKPKEETKEEQKKTKEEQQNKTRKDLVVEFMKKHVEEYKTSSSAMIWVGATAPGAAVLLKKSGEKVPQVKKLRIDLVPNFVFVPTVTMLSLIAVRMLNVTKTSRSTS